MRRREIVAHARMLQEKLEGIAKRYDAASSVDDKMLDFDEVLFEINSFYRNVAPSPSLKVFRLLEEFQGLIENIREGRPSLADDFKKKSGQRMGVLGLQLMPVCANLGLN
jgi:hypothetical protein